MTLSKIGSSNQDSPDKSRIHDLPPGPGQIVSILMKEGTLTEKQVNYALRIQAKLETPGTLLDVLKELDYLSEDKISDVIRRNYSLFRIGDLLVELGHITSRQLKTCLAAQAKEKTGRKLGEMLVEYNFIREKKLLEILSVQLRVPLIDVEFVDFDRRLITLQRLKSFREFIFIPIRREEDAVLVAFADPGNQKGIEKAENIFECRIIPGIARESAILKMITVFQTDIKKTVYANEPEMSLPDIVDRIILDAMASGVSDIHIEPLTDRLRIRFRQDGVLIHYKDYPREIIPALSSRFKSYVSGGHC